MMVVFDHVDKKGIRYLRVWPDGSPEQEHNTMIWKAETFRRYFKPEKDGHD
jgi:hypothetical protein